MFWEMFLSLANERSFFHHLELNSFCYATDLIRLFKAGPQRYHKGMEHNFISKSRWKFVNEALAKMTSRKENDQEWK